MSFDFEKLMRNLFEVGVAAASPSVQMPVVWENRIFPWLENVAPKRERIWVFGAGKAAASMTKALEEAVFGHISSRSQPNDHAQNQFKGFVITRQGYGLPTRWIEVKEASHPVPDARGQRAALDMLEALAAVPADEPVIALISGGGSSLLSTPEPGITFEELQALNRGLLSAGTPISEINTVRKHVCASLGGKMARACKAPIFQIIISDVPGDDPSVVASGPFCPDSSTYGDALAVLARWDVQASDSIMNHLRSGEAGQLEETPKAESVAFARLETCLLASASTMLAAVSNRLEEAGYQVLSLGDTLEAESRDVAAVHAAMVKQVCTGQKNWPSIPLAIVSGGECSVTLPANNLGRHKGGRNTEFLLALVCQLSGYETKWPIAAMAADTDGTDGLGDQAGALMLPEDFEKAIAMGLNARKHLDQHATADYFEGMDRLLMTGPTQTNVNDLRVILIGEPLRPTH